MFLFVGLANSLATSDAFLACRRDVEVSCLPLLATAILAYIRDTDAHVFGFENFLNHTDNEITDPHLNQKG